MPNYVTNRLRCHKDNWDELCNLLLNEEGNVDFDRVIPCPDSVYRGEIRFGEPCPEGYDETWYSWNPQQWGTKWNATWTEIHEDECEVEFITAWNFPAPVMEALGKLMSFEIAGVYADEDLGYNLGVFSLDAGGVSYVDLCPNFPDGEYLTNLASLIRYECSYRDWMGEDYGTGCSYFSPHPLLEETYDVWERYGLSFS